MRERRLWNQTQPDRLLALLLSNRVTLDKLLHPSGLFLSKKGAWFLYLGVDGRTLRCVW